eukprot:m.356424 g.356424  ORF g.356424 m.356424 type:complete len:89 (+) comp17541_c0_seq1:1996-2262(+)
MSLYPEITTSTEKEGGVLFDTSVSVVTVVLRSFNSPLHEGKFIVQAHLTNPVSPVRLCTLSGRRAHTTEALCGAPSVTSAIFLRCCYL